MLTGTPLQNDLQELRNLLQFLLPDVFTKEHFSQSEDLQVSLTSCPFISGPCAGVLALVGAADHMPPAPGCLLMSRAIGDAGTWYAHDMHKLSNYSDGNTSYNAKNTHRYFLSLCAAGRRGCT